MTFERYIAVSQPLRASQICTIKRARYMLLFVFTIFFLINSHFLWTFHLSPTIQHCIPLNDQSLFIRYFTWIDSFKYSFCPLTLLITLNILIIRSLLNARNTNKYLQHEISSSDNLCQQSKTSYSISFSSTSTTNNSANTLIRKKPIRHHSRPSHSYQQSTKALTYRRVNRRLTTMLLAVSFAFCICSMPISIMQLIDALYSDIDKRSTTMSIGIAIGKIIAEISQYLNHCMPFVSFFLFLNFSFFVLASNFFLYAFTGRVFRHELRRLFTCHRFLFFKTSLTSSQRLKNRAKKLMLIHNPSQGVHEHFYANGKRHTRILIAPKPRTSTTNYSDNCTYRQSLCSAYSSSEIPLTNQIRQNSLMMTDEQDEHFLTCRYQPRASSVTQTTSIVLFDSPTTSIRNRNSLVSFVENIKHQQLDQTTPLLNSSYEQNHFKPYGLTDTASHLIPN